MSLESVLSTAEKVAALVSGGIGDGTEFHPEIASHRATMQYALTTVLPTVSEDNGAADYANLADLCYPDQNRGNFIRARSLSNSGLLARTDELAFQRTVTEMADTMLNVGVEEAKSRIVRTPRGYTYFAEDFTGEVEESPDEEE